MKPTISTPSACRRSMSSRSSLIAALPVPTSSSRCRGPTRFDSHSKAMRQPDTNTVTKPAARKNTPRPIIVAGNQKYTAASTNEAPPSAWMIRTSSSLRSAILSKIVEVGVIETQLADRGNQ